MIKTKYLSFMSTPYTGNGYYCVRDASVGYFGKPPSEMTIMKVHCLRAFQCSFHICATENPELAGERHAQVIDRMIK